MDTMTILKIVFTALLCVPVFTIHSFNRKLMDEIVLNQGGKMKPGLFITFEGPTVREDNTNPDAGGLSCL